MTPEGKVKEQIKRILRKHGAYYVMPTTFGMGRSGATDFVACCYGFFVAIEAKAGSNAPTLLQQKHMNDVEAAGGISLVVNEENIDELDDTIEGLRGVRV